MHLILFVTYTKRMFRAHRIISRCRQIEVWAVALASALAFTFWGLRFTLAEENGSLRPDVAKWVAQLRDEDDVARRQAAYALGQMGPEAATAVAALRDALTERHVEVRWYVLDALGRIGPKAKEAVPALSAVLEEGRNNDHPNTIKARVLAARAVGRIGLAANGALPALRDAQQDKAREVRIAAAVAIWRINGDDVAISLLGKELASDDRRGSFAAATALLELGADARPAEAALVAALGHRDPDVRRAAARTLGHFGTSAAAAIGEAIRSPEVEKRAAAATACGWIADGIRAQIFSDPRAPTPEFKQAAVEVYEKLFPLVILAVRDAAREVQDAGIESLARAGPHAIPVLLRWLTADDKLSRNRAQRGLVALERYLPQAEIPEEMAQINKRVLPRLIAAIEHPDAEVRRSGFRAFAALSIGIYGTEAAAVLLEGLHDPDPMIRRWADQSLRRLDNDSSNRESSK